MRTCLFLLPFFLLLPFTVAAAGGEAGIGTFWPFFDYRSSPEVDYRSIHSLGPLFKHETKGDETEIALRPLAYRATDRKGASLLEILYPLASLRTSPEHSSFSLLQLLQYDFVDSAKGQESEFMAFPLVFSRQADAQDDYFAVFPFGGKILGRFWRDEIRFTLFPLYSQTRLDGRITTHLLWPFFSHISGDNESGFELWPLFGQSQKVGVYRKQFLLWPVFFRQDLDFDTEAPVRLRAAFPFYVSEQSPDKSSSTILWPFFSHHDNRLENYEEWNFPLPLLRITRGEGRHGNRFLPFYADESVGSNRKRWFLWPLYKIEETRTEIIERRRDRVLFFLYSDLSEKRIEEDAPYKERVALWPVFTYQKVKGVSQFHLLALTEPFFPENTALERNWAPLWRLYQRKWDGDGNSASTLLWNLYWKEVRGEDLAMEIFPLLAYCTEKGKGLELSLLKGLFRYRSHGETHRINLLYLPWGISWGDGKASAGM